MTAAQTIILSSMCARGQGRRRGRELSDTLANHLMGSYTELTFEGYRSISLHMKKREPRKTGRRIGYAASVQSSRQLLSMHLSIHPHHAASSPLWSPPTQVLPLHAPFLSPLLSIYQAQGEERGRAKMKGRRRNTARGWAREGWMST